MKKEKLFVILLVTILAIPSGQFVFVSYGATSHSNPSVVPGSQALTVGPYINKVTYPFFTSDHASDSALIAGQANIIDYPPPIADYQNILNTPYINTTVEYGASFESLFFNQNSAKDAGYYFPFRQAVAQIVNYTYMQDVALNGVQGIVSSNVFIPAAFGNYTTNDIYQYHTSLQGANTSLAQDPQIAWNAKASPTNVGTEYACTSSQVGVWQYATSAGSGKANGTDFNPKFYARPDFATWYTASQQIWRDAAKIGLCIDLKSVSHFSSVYPIVFAGFSDKWAMYFGGNSYGVPLNPVGTLEFGYGQQGIALGPLAGNPTKFYNSTVQAVIDDMVHSGSVAQQQADSRQIVKYLSYLIPQELMFWDTWAIPSLNNYGGTYWSGYVDTPGFGTWSFGTGYFTLLNLHRVNPTTGATISGGTGIVNLREAPDDYNVAFAGSVYDFDLLNAIYFDTPIASNPASPYITNVLPWMLTSPPKTQLPVNMTTPHGHKLVNGQVIHLNFMDNITFQDNVRMTANDYNFSLWYLNLNGAYGPYVGNNQSNYVGLVPALADSQVQNKTSMTIYVNSTSQTDWQYVLTNPVLPEHLWSHVGSSAFNGDIDPTSAANAVNGQLLITGVGAFYWSSFVQSQYATLSRFPGYFRSNIQAHQLPQMASGASQPVSLAITQMGTPIPSSASVSVTAQMKGGTPQTMTLTHGSNGNWTGTLTTTGWAPGFYKVTVNGTYTDSSGLQHEALQFYGLDVTGASTTTHSTQTTSSASTSHHTTTSSTGTQSTAAPDYTIYYAAAAVIVVILVVVGIAARSRRKPS
jgi:hypothetical protein